MKRLVLYALTLMQLSLFGASYKEVATDVSDPVKPFNVHKLISVTQGKSKMPYQIAYRSIGANKLLACLVADPKLDEIFPDVSIAQEAVDAMPEDIGEYDDFMSVKDACTKVQLAKLCTQALKEGKVKAQVMGLFIFAKTLSNSVGSERATIKLMSFWNGDRNWYSNGTFTTGSAAAFSVKVDSAGAVVHESAFSKKDSALQELQKRGEHAAILELWKKRLETNHHDFAFKVVSRDIEECFAHQTRLALQPVACSTCSVL